MLSDGNGYPSPFFIPATPLPVVPLFGPAGFYVRGSLGEILKSVIVLAVGVSCIYQTLPLLRRLLLENLRGYLAHGQVLQVVEAFDLFDAMCRFALTSNVGNPFKKTHLILRQITEIMQLIRHLKEADWMGDTSEMEEDELTGRLCNRFWGYVNALAK